MSDIYTYLGYISLVHHVTQVLKNYSMSKKEGRYMTMMT